MVDFELIMLGRFELRDATRAPVQLTLRKARALLAVLGVRPGETVSRARIAALLWGDRGEEQARASLRQSLSQVRKALGDADSHLLISTGDGLMIDGERVASDVERFDRHLAAATAEAASAEELRRAVELYRGPFLDAFDLGEEAFEEWLTAERRRLEAGIVRAHSQLARHSESAGEIETARSHLAEVLRIAPLREDLQRDAMRLALTAGQATEALGRYEEFRSLLADQLGVEPQEETRRLYEEILSRRSSAEPTPSPPHPEASDVWTGGKPSIAVLPFLNLSGDPEQELFADGMTEDIITELSRFRGLLVIARNSTFVYKNQVVDPREIARELDVRYLLEGSVRTHGGRIRVSAQLIDAAGRHPIWAERYDRELVDLFTLQDEITRTLVAAIEPELDDAERRSAISGRRERLDAWGAYHRGMWHVYRFTREDTRQALELFEEAIAHEPSFSPGWSGKSFAHFNNAFLGYVEDREGERRLALEAGRKSVEIDPRDATAHWALARAYTLGADYDRAIPELAEAVALNTNFAHAWYQLGWALVRVGRPEEAEAPAARAERLSPNDPLRFAFQIVRAQARFALGETDEALAIAERAANQPHAHFHIEAIRIACLIRCGRVEEARGAMDAFRGRHPDYSRSFFREAHAFKRERDAALYVDALAKAGLPA